MADQVAANYALVSSNHAMSTTWKLTRVMKKAGWVKFASSDGSAKEVSRTASADKWGGNADPLLDSYPSIDTANASWWAAEGPKTHKISMTSAPTGTFVRGESVTQTTSGATGEFLGYDFDGVSTGHAVILPRTGTFDGTHIITGATSGATFTATALDTFAIQVVFFKAASSTVNGSIYVQVVSSVNETSSQFETLASAAGCTATVAPGGGGTGNAMPSLGTFVARGSQNAGTPTHDSWFWATTNFVTGQAVALNCTPAAGISADGTFWAGIGNTTTTTQFNFWGFFRLDDSEPADVFPFAFYSPASIVKNSANARTDATGVQSTNGSNNASFFQGSTAAGAVFTWRTWRRRGFASADAFMAAMVTFTDGYGNGVGSPLMGDNIAAPETIACAYTTQYVREEIRIVNTDNTLKCRKGRLRWAWQCQKGTTFDTADGKLKFAVIPAASSQGTVYLGKYDGTTTPIQ